LGYHDDLLDQAAKLIRREPRKPKQASLRRAVSSAYYAIFHLLVSETVANWRHRDQRSTLGREFSHTNMKSASNRILDKRNFPFLGEDPTLVKDLRYIAETFTELQEQRHIADYDNSTIWTRTGAQTKVDSVRRAFAIWPKIRNEGITQAYLFSLLIKKRD
jgi:hypothetical protein